MCFYLRCITFINIKFLHIWTYIRHKIKIKSFLELQPHFWVSVRYLSTSWEHVASLIKTVRTQSSPVFMFALVRIYSERYLTWIYFAHMVHNVGWRERNQQDATNLMFIIKLSQHVSGIIVPIIRRTIVCTAAYGVLHWLWWLWLCGAGTRAVCTVKVTVRTLTFTVHTARVPAPLNHSHHYQCWTPYAAVHTLVLLMMRIMMPETCSDKRLIISIRLVASCWFLSLHPLLYLYIQGSKVLLALLDPWP